MQMYAQIYDEVADVHVNVWELSRLVWISSGCYESHVGKFGRKSFG